MENLVVSAISSAYTTQALPINKVDGATLDKGFTHSQLAKQFAEEMGSGTISHKSLNLEMISSDSKAKGSMERVEEGLQKVSDNHITMTDKISQNLMNFENLSFNDVLHLHVRISAASFKTKVAAQFAGKGSEGLQKIFQNQL